MQQNWNNVFEKYVKNLTSPDGRDTFESMPQLIEKILSIANIQGSDTVIDIGSGWGNLTIPAAKYCSSIIGIEPNKDNIKEAQARSKGESIQFIQGSFEKPHCKEKADIIISSLVFHQVKQSKRKKALQNVADLLKPGGRFILCDTIMLFDAENDADQFNEIYRYLLPKTTPRNIYEKYILPNLEEGYTYTWKDMKKYTPQNCWYYSIRELENWLIDCGMEINKKVEISPFFGIVVCKVNT